MLAFIFGDACERENLFLNVTSGRSRTLGIFYDGKYIIEFKEMQYLYEPILAIPEKMRYTN